MNYYNVFLSYFPKINYKIKDIRLETQTQYSLPGINLPFNTPPPGSEYSQEILSDLRILREILNNESLSEEKLHIELVRLLKHWGPENRNILTYNLINLIIELLKIISIQNKVMEYAKEMDLYFTNREIEVLSNNFLSEMVPGQNSEITTYDIDKLFKNLLSEMVPGKNSEITTDDIDNLFKKLNIGRKKIPREFYTPPYRKQSFKYGIKKSIGHNGNKRK